MSPFPIYVWHQFQFSKPCRRLTVAGRPIVAARRKRSARADFRRIRNAASFELAQLEEPKQEGTQMSFDFGEIVLVTFVLRNIRPRIKQAIMPRTISQESDFGRGKPEADRVIEVKILQFVRPDERLGCLNRAGLPRHQFRADLSGEDLL